MSIALLFLTALAIDSLCGGRPFQLLRTGFAAASDLAKSCQGAEGPAIHAAG